MILKRNRIIEPEALLPAGQRLLKCCPAFSNEAMPFGKKEERIRFHSFLVLDFIFYLLWLLKKARNNRLSLTRSAAAGWYLIEITLQSMT
jgi:hypothetical protein